MEDFKDAPTEVAPPLEKLFGTLNPFLSDVSNALDRRLTTKDNHASVYRSVTVTAPGETWTAPTYVNSWVDFASTLRTGGYRITPEGVVLVRFTVKSGVSGHIFTLPTGYIPSQDETHDGWSNGAGCAVTVNGQTNANPGRVVATNYTNTDVHGHFSFEASATGPAAAPAAFTGAGWPIALAPTGDDGRALGQAVEEVRLVRVTDLLAQTNKSHAAAAPDWVRDAKGGVRINRVAGLSPGRQYKLTFLLTA